MKINFSLHREEKQLEINFIFYLFINSLIINSSQKI